MAPLPAGAPVGVYIHIPFCGHICPYCDFNTYANMEPLIPAYVDAVCTDIARFPGRFGSMPAATIFFGGGTPSLVPAEGIARMIDAVRNSFDLAAGAEITLEANPNRLDQRYCTGLLDAGVNRLSLGAQTFDRRGLRTLGRQHEAEDVVTAIVAARAAGFANVSCDLIFGWPGQAMDVWRNDLDRVLALDAGVDHLSLYSLIIEPGTPMAEAVARGILVPLSDDEAADCYEIAVEVLGKAGWIHYEIANWAKSAAYQSRHNMLYWRNGEYAGFGAGAHWRIGDRRRMNHLLPRTYVDAVEGGEDSASNSEEVSDRLSISETMMLGLRLLREGVTEASFQVRHSASLAESFPRQLDALAAHGLIDWDGERVLLTHRGSMLANDVCSQFFDEQ
ncbi:MAG: radical SAM family heme chaperone HemW [Thermomicrobiales bacterium]|nr:radical SAM family heme chaperone HemW [Thermomicrobiales bacterium]